MKLIRSSCFTGSCQHLTKREEFMKPKASSRVEMPRLWQSNTHQSGLQQSRKESGQEIRPPEDTAKRQNWWDFSKIWEMLSQASLCFSIQLSANFCGQILNMKLLNLFYIRSAGFQSLCLFLGHDLWVFCAFVNALSISLSADDLLTFCETCLCSFYCLSYFYDIFYFITFSSTCICFFSPFQVQTFSEISNFIIDLKQSIFSETAFLQLTSKSAFF